MRDDRAMFSYRHAFHAGNHADVLKHMTLLACLRHLTQKDAALHVFDTHAGSGLYKLDSEHARKSGESLDGVSKLLEKHFLAQNQPSVHMKSAPDATDFDVSAMPAALADYVNLLLQLNPGSRMRVYPGSPFLARSALRPQDRMTLCELHPSDTRNLQKHVNEADPAGAKMQVLQKDGFDTLPKLLPPPPTDARGSRRALVLMDPSYELKTDYARALEAIATSLKKFPTGCYVLWYPIIARPEAHGLPRKLKTLCTQSAKPWVHATLNVGRAEKAQPQERGTSLSASGMWVINPPHTLAASLREALPVVQTLLAQGRGAAWEVSAAG